MRKTALLLLLLACAGDGSSEVPPRRRSATRLDALGRTMRRVVRALEERGHVRTGLTGRSLLLERGGDVQSFDLAGGSCYTVVALPGRARMDVAVALFDDQGVEVARDDGSSVGGLVHVCPQVPGTHYLVARPVGGATVYAYALLRSAPGRAKFDGVLPEAAGPAPSGDRLARDRQRASAESFAERGFEQYGEATEGWLATGDVNRDARILLAPEHCYRLVATGGEGVVDLDAFLYGPSGTEVARDVGNEPESRVEVCPAVPGVYTLEVSMYEGSGPYVLGVYRGPPDGGPESPGSAPAIEPTDLGAETARLDAEMSRRGLVVHSPFSEEEELPSSGTQKHRIELPAGCAAIVVRGGEGVRDLDLYLHTEDGAPADRDLSFGPVATVHACPTTASLFEARVRMWSGRGRYALGVYRSPTISDLLTFRLHEASAALEADGLVGRGPAQTGSLEEGESVRASIRVVRGRCYGVAVAGASELEDLDLFLYDDEGEPLAADTSPLPRGTVRRCAEDEATWAIEARAYAGSGDYLLRVFEGPSSRASPPSAPPSTAHPPR